MELVALGFLLLLTYLVVLAVYRLYVSPLAKFPGPKLAALSKWYEAFFEIVRNGEFSFQIDKLHDQYGKTISPDIDLSLILCLGPIVRITPEELHIRDSTFYDTLYVRYAKAHRFAWISGRFGNDDSVFTTADSGVHRMRRGALNAMLVS